MRKVVSVDRHRNRFQRNEGAAMQGDKHLQNFTSSLEKISLPKLIVSFMYERKGQPLACNQVSKQPIELNTSDVFSKSAWREDNSQWL